jgi:PTS system beta-glucosides-specific IIC component
MILPLIMSNISNLGQDPIFPIACAAVLSQAGSALGVFLKTRNKQMKQVSGAASIAAIFGITEPALYGVTLKYRKPFYIAISVSAVSGIIIGLSGVQAHAFAFPSILSIPTYLGKGFVWEIIALVISFFGAAILTYLFGLNGVKDDELVSIDNETYRIPVEGEKIDLKEVNDPVFSSGEMGQGIAIKPASDEIVAPIDGKVTVTFDTNHAIGITDKMGSQVLIHIGVDTVNLKGAYFNSLVKKGDKVIQGQKLIEFDHAAIEQEGYDATVMMIITNSSEYQIETNLDNLDTNALSVSKK